MAQLPPGFVLDGAASGPVFGPPPKAPPPRDPLMMRKDQLDILKAERDLAKPEGNDAPSGYRWGANGALEPIPGGPADKAAGGGTEDDVKIQQKRAALTSLETQINRVHELYTRGLKDEALGILSSIGEFLPTEDNRQFDAAAAGMAEQGLAAFRVPGVGAQSDTELRQFVQANKPSASDYDSTIEEKLRQLKVRVDATRQEMGLPPAKWIGQDGAASQEINGQRIFNQGGGEQRVLTDGDSAGGLAGGTHTEQDPQAAGLNGEINALLKRGASNRDIVNVLRQRGADNAALVGIMQQLNKVRAFQKQYPDYKGDYSIDVERRTVPNSVWNNVASSAAGTALASAGDAVTGFNLDSISGAMGGDASQTRAALDLARQENPGSAMVGTLAGGTLAALAGEAGLARLGMGAGTSRALLADTGYGATAGAGLADDGNRATGAISGGLAGLLGSVAGQGLTKATGSVISGVSNPAVRTVADEGVPMTIGQAVGESGVAGRFVKGAEDRLAGFSGVGDVINARRTEGIQVMNAKAFDKALEPINETVGGKFGEEAVAEAQDKVSQAFTRALSGKVAGLDRQFIGEASSAKASIRSIPRVADEVESSVDEVVASYFDASGRISGENMQALLRDLGQIKRAYKNDPLGHRIGKSIGKVEDAVEGLFRRQAPDVMPQYESAKKAFRRLSILEGAVMRAKNNPEGGNALFTSGQLGMADRANAKKFSGAHAAAAGKGEFHDFQRAMQEVLPNEVPDSGTAGRVAMMAVPAAIAGSGAGVGYAAGDAQTGAATGLGLGGLLALAYTKRGQGALVNAAVKRGPKAQAVGKAIKGRARLIGASGATAAVQGTSPDR
jgi:hypothetical protein